MPSALALTYAARVESFRGVEVPWEILSYSEDYARAELKGALFDLSFWDVLEIRGKDARDFLQRLSTVDFRKPFNELRYGAFLNAKAQAQGFGIFRSLPDGAQIGLTPGQMESLATHLEMLHFTEDLRIHAASDQAILGAWGSTETLNSVCEGLPAFVSPRQTQLRFLVGSREEIAGRLKRASVAEILGGQALFEFYRIRDGLADFGPDIAGSDLFPEAGWHSAVADQKGCYPGQEVVERIRTYGRLNRELRRVQIEELPEDPATLVALPWDLSYQGTRVGKLTSLARYPDEKRSAVGIAYLGRAMWDSTAPLVGPNEVQVLVRK